MGRIRFRSSVRSPCESRQRRRDAGSGELQRRQDALSRPRDGTWIDHDCERNRRAHGARSPALQEGYLRGLRGPGRAGAPRQEEMAPSRCRRRGALHRRARARRNRDCRRQRQRLPRRLPPVGRRTRSPAHRDSLETTDLIGEVAQMAARSEMPRPRSTSRPAAWRALEDHYGTMRGRHLRDLFAEDPARGERMTAEAAGVFLDYSKNRVEDETLSLLVGLAEQSGLRERIDAMFRGEKINVTEKRAVLHVALRAPRGASIVVDGKNVVPEVHDVLDKMAEFANRVRSGQWKGHTGKRIRNVINIGIGGSDLGPVMAYEALKYYSDRAMTFRFVSNVDGTDFVEA